VDLPSNNAQRVTTACDVGILHENIGPKPNEEWVYDITRWPISVYISSIPLEGQRQIDVNIRYLTESTI